MSASLIAAGLTAGLGTAQLIQSGIQNRRAKKMQLQQESAEQRLQLANLRRKEKALETGLAADRQSKSIDKVVAAISKAGLRGSGGGGGATIAAVRRAMAVGGEQKANLIGSLRREALPFTQMIGQQVADIQGRKDEITLMERAKLEAKGAQASKSGQQNLLAGLTSAISGGLPLPEETESTTGGTQ